MKKIFSLSALLTICFMLVTIVVSAVEEYGSEHQIINPDESFSYTSLGYLPTSYYALTKVNGVWGTMDMSMQVQKRVLLVYMNVTSWNQSFSTVNTYAKHIGTTTSNVTRTYWTKTNSGVLGYGYLQGGYSY